MYRENSDLEKRIGQAKLDRKDTRTESRTRFIYEKRKKLKHVNFFLLNPPHRLILDRHLLCQRDPDQLLH